ncbi:MAG TPA: type IV pilus modification protein PilV [Burkholderiaceae bacterium]|nr:type IV pilus modification protein PilV [Burkholderiaceae bacterium]
MIESLVAIVVLSFGMLGVVGLQAAALQSNKEARYQSSAVRLARELGELLRGNKNVAIEAASADNPYLVTFTGTLPSTSADCFAGACATALDVASFQIVEWLRRVDAELPGARVSVCIDDASFDSGGLPVWACSGTGGTVVVKIGWTQATTDHGAVGSSSSGSSTPGLARATRPGVVVALIAGSSE